MFRAWEIKTSRVEEPLPSKKVFPKIYFRHVEKIMLYLAKHIVQWIILMVVKYYYIFTTKTKKWVKTNSPKIHKFFNKKPKGEYQQKNGFVRRAVLESKVKIKHIREKVKKEHA